MAYSKSLAARIRHTLQGHRGIVEKQMFGGMGFLLRGNMLVGVWQHSLIARLGPEQGDAALDEPHVAPFDVTGRPMNGWVMVEPEGLDTEDELAGWLDRALAFVVTLPAK